MMMALKLGKTRNSFADAIIEKQFMKRARVSHIMKRQQIYASLQMLLTDSHIFFSFSLQEINILASWRTYPIIHLIRRPCCGDHEGKAVSSLTTDNEVNSCLRRIASDTKWHIVWRLGREGEAMEAKGPFGGCHDFSNNLEVGDFSNFHTTCKHSRRTDNFL